jgi:hypothetical protein
MACPIHPIHPIRPYRLTTRRLIVIVAISAVAFSGLHCGNTPGWHVLVPWTTVHVGACQNRTDGFTVIADGRPGRWPVQVGVWDGRRRAKGRILWGVSIRDGIAIVYRGKAAPVVVW